MVQVEIHAGIAQLILHNPDRHNALSHSVVDGLAAAVARLALARDVRAVVVHGGAAPSFCAGADLKERVGMDEATVFATVHRLRAAVDGVARLPLPVIAAIHGSCFGGGMELALACDLRLASPDAQMGLTEAALAIIPGAGGTQRLPRIVGVARAKEMIFTAARLSAEEAMAAGLLNRIVPREQLLPEALAMAGRIAEMGPLAIRAAKWAIDGGQALAAGLAMEWDAYQTIIPTGDRREGLAAFSARRKPEYRGE